MEKVIIEIIPNGPYATGERNSIAIGHLGHFLTDDVSCRSVDSWKEWFSDPSTTWTGSNYSDWEKDGNRLSLGFSGDIDDDNAPRWETTTEQMNYILNRWQEVCRKKA